MNVVNTDISIFLRCATTGRTVGICCVMDQTVTLSVKLMPLVVTCFVVLRIALSIVKPALYVTY